MTSAELTARIAEAFKLVTRSHFMRASDRNMADIDRPFPIGYSQTISQPTTVKHMLTWLAPEAGQKILDVGSGSGWTTALLSHLVGEKGKVFATERIEELTRFGSQNCQRFGCENVEFFNTKNEFGLAEFAPYDRILVSAAASDSIPQELVKQLAAGGKMVIPVDNSIFELQKDSDGEVEFTRKHTGYLFVPLL